MTCLRSTGRADWGVDQQPAFQVSGNFPVTLLLGGKGLPPAAASPDPLELLSAAAPAVSQVMHGAGVQVAGNQTIHGDLVLGSKI